MEKYLQMVLKEHQNAQDIARDGYVKLYGAIGEKIFNFTDKVIEGAELGKDGELVVNIDKVVEYKRDMLFEIKKSLEWYETECLKWRVPDNEE